MLRAVTLKAQADDKANVAECGLRKLQLACLVDDALADPRIRKLSTGFEDLIELSAVGEMKSQEHATP